MAPLLGWSVRQLKRIAKLKASMWIRLFLLACIASAIGLAVRSFGMSAQPGIYAAASKIKIPCLGVVTGPDPNLHLLRMFYSIDHPVQEICVAHGSNDIYLAAELNQLVHVSSNLTLHDLGRWPGVAQGWNRCIQRCTNSDWYLIVNMDIQVNTRALRLLKNALAH